jgi:HK97 family phage major capsid protein
MGLPARQIVMVARAAGKGITMKTELVQRLEELRDRRAVLLAEARGILDTVKSEGRDLTDTEDKAVVAKHAEVDKLMKEVRRLEAHVHRERDLNAPASEPVDMSMGRGRPESGLLRPPARTYGAMFAAPAAGLTDGRFDSFEDFLRAVHRGLDERLALTGMYEGIPSEGGFLVPEQFAAMLLDKSLEDEIVRPRAAVYPMASASRKIPAWDGSDHTSSLYGGLTGTWLAEKATGSEVAAKLRQIELVARKLGIYTSASNELVADGLTFEEMLGNALVKTLAWHLDLAFLTGLGGGQPLGVLNDNALITVAKETGQLADTVVWENVANMYSRMHPGCINKAVWVCNQSVLPQLLSLSIGVGTAGVLYPALREDAGAFWLLGRPVLITEKLPALGNKGDVLFADFSQYAVGLRKEVSLDKSAAVGWHTDQTGYRCMLRVDGRGTWDKAITPKNGSTLSWCVTLAERA